MQHNFDDYKIHIVESNNYNGKWVCYIEELYNVSEIIDNKKQAIESLRALFEKEIVRLKTFNLEIPKPNSGKAVITFAPNEKVNSLRPFIDIFWKDVLCTSYNTSFVSDESTFYPWEQYLEGGKDELIDKVRKIYKVDISAIYDRRVYEILNFIRRHSNRHGILYRCFSILFRH